MGTAWSVLSEPAESLHWLPLLSWHKLQSVSSYWLDQLSSSVSLHLRANISAVHSAGRTDSFSLLLPAQAADSLLGHWLRNSAGKYSWHVKGRTYGKNCVSYLDILSARHDHL